MLTNGDPPKFAERSEAYRGRHRSGHQPQLAAETPCREGRPARTAPPRVAMRPEASHHPSIELVKESPHVGALVGLAPSANDRVEFADQLRGLEREATLRFSGGPCP